ncbi:MAG: hypothetical protein IIV53_01380 [Bacteroidaceae bacterium]|jgi:hypothetical protein|nr:hypothetical protein [Bacteroidaceae bacterium]
MFGLEKPRFRDAFEAEIIGNITKRFGDISSANKEDLEKECIYYTADMCIEFYEKSGGFLPNDWRDHIFNEVCAVFDKHFTGKYNRGFCEFMFIPMMSNLNNARQGVRNYYNRF